jgi:hypothetical protein
MNGEGDVMAPGDRPRVRAGVLALLAACCFLLGLAAMAWLITHWESGARMLGFMPAQEQVVQRPPPPAPVQPQPAAPAVAAPPSATQPERVIIDPEVSRRVAALEQRVDQIDLQSRSAVGNADRAEGLLVAFAARRALDRGVGLGFLEGLLQRRFGQSQPRAVGMIILASHNPVTLQELQLELGDIGAQLLGTPADATWWDALKAQLSTLVTVRRRGTPSPEPAERLRRATQRLEAGQVEVALAEVMRLPGRERASAWIRKARLYSDARAALDTIETAALLEPRAGDAAPAVPNGSQPPPAAPAADQAARRRPATR